MSNKKTIDLDALIQVGTNGAATEVARGRKHKHPQGWEPGITLSADGGTIITDPVTRGAAPNAADWDTILDELLPPSVDREGLAIDTAAPVEMRAWDAPDGAGGTRRLYYFKARIVRRGGPTDDKPDVTDLVNSLMKAKVKPLPEVANGNRTYFVQITDLQAGQADGDGIEGMVTRALQVADLVVRNVRALQKAGKPVANIFIPITGDLVEGIEGWYAMQTFSVTLDRREQVKLVRRLLTEIIKRIRQKLNLPVHAAVVPGNHGENRQAGKAYTTLGDNDDVAVVEAIAEAFALAQIDGVTFSFPDRERLSMTVEVQGWVVGLTHGHLARGGTGTEGKILNWFKAMAASRDPIGDSDILFTGHYHHARYQQLIGDTVWIQGGALCDASAWFSQSFGLVSDPIVVMGTITREQKIETIDLHSWPRSRVETRNV